MSEQLTRPPPKRDWRARLDELRTMAPVTPAGMLLIACGLVIAIVLGILAVRMLQTPPPPELSLPRATPASTLPSVSAAPSALVVHVAGAVTRPGVYRLDSSARVDDAVSAAGGVTADADLDAVNLAAKVSDGDRVFVPRKGEVPPSVSPVGPSQTSAPSGPVNLNRATLEELETLPGIGPATAQAIIAWRREHGAFQSVQDLLQVRGIGPAKLESLRDLVTV
jgi:competence protein ComEA